MVVGKGAFRTVQGGRKLARTLGNINANKRADRRQQRVEKNSEKRRIALGDYNTELASYNQALQTASQDDLNKKK